MRYSTCVLVFDVIYGLILQYSSTYSSTVPNSLLLLSGAAPWRRGQILAPKQIAVAECSARAKWKRRSSPKTKQFVKTPENARHPARFSSSCISSSFPHPTYTYVYSSIATNGARVYIIHSSSSFFSCFAVLPTKLPR